MTTETGKAMCDMVEGCTNPVTHIGEKGYVYCASCVSRRAGYERCRRMAKWEIDRVNSGMYLHSYTPITLAESNRLDIAESDRRLMRLADATCNRVWEEEH